MDGKDDRDIGSLGHIGNRPRYFGHAFAEILAAMRCDGNDPPARKAVGERIETCDELRPRLYEARGRKQSVDDSVPRDVNISGGNIFLEQGIASCFRRRKMLVGNDRGEPPVRFFRPRLVNIKTAQPGLDMVDRDFAIVGRKGRRHRSQRVAMNDDARRGFLVQRSAKPGQRTRHETIERLTVLHQVEIDVRHDARHCKHLVEQGPVLRRHSDARLDALQRAQGVNDRKHLDRFRPRAKYDQDALSCRTRDGHVSLRPDWRPARPSPGISKICGDGGFGSIAAPRGVQFGRTPIVAAVVGLKSDPRQ